MDSVELKDAREQAAATVAGALARFVERAQSAAGNTPGFGMSFLQDQTTEVLRLATLDPGLNETIEQAVTPKGGSVA